MPPVPYSNSTKISVKVEGQRSRSDVKVKPHQNLITSSVHRGTCSCQVTSIFDEQFFSYCTDRQTDTRMDVDKAIPSFACVQGNNDELFHNIAYISAITTQLCSHSANFTFYCILYYFIFRHTKPSWFSMSKNKSY